MQLTATEITERIIEVMVVQYQHEVVFSDSEVSRESMFRAAIAHMAHCAHDTEEGTFRLRYWKFPEWEFPEPRFFIVR